MRIGLMGASEIFKNQSFRNKLFLSSHLPNQCTLSAKDRGATKNPVVDLELILMHHFSRILHLDFSSVLSKALSFTSRISKSLKIWSTKSAKTRHLCTSIFAHSLHSMAIFCKIIYWVKQETNL